MTATEAAESNPFFSEQSQLDAGTASVQAENSVETDLFVCCSCKRHSQQIEKIYLESASSEGRGIEEPSDGFKEENCLQINLYSNCSNTSLEYLILEYARVDTMTW